MMKPLNKDELREKISTLSVDGHQLQNYLGSQHVDMLVNLILSDRKAHEESIKNIIKMSDKYTFADGTVFVRQRNQGENNG